MKTEDCQLKAFVLILSLKGVHGAENWECPGRQSRKGLSFWETLGLIVLLRQTQEELVRILLVHDTGSKWVDFEVSRKYGRELEGITLPNVSKLRKAIVDLKNGAEARKNFSIQNSLDASLLTSLCYFNRLERELDDSIRVNNSRLIPNRILRKEILCIMFDEENTSREASLNGALCAAKENVPVSFLFLRGDESHIKQMKIPEESQQDFARKTAFLTNGNVKSCTSENFFEESIRNSELLGSATGHITGKDKLDFRALCSCHQSRCSVGRLCSGCLAIYCPKYRRKSCKICFPFDAK